MSGVWRVFKSKVERKGKLLMIGVDDQLVEPITEIPKGIVQVLQAKKAMVVQIIGKVSKNNNER